MSAVYEHKRKLNLNEFTSNFVEIRTQHLRFDLYCNLLSSDFVGGGVNFSQLHKYKLALTLSLVFFE